MSIAIDSDKRRFDLVMDSVDIFVYGALVQHQSCVVIIAIEQIPSLIVVQSISRPFVPLLHDHVVVIQSLR